MHDWAELSWCEPELGRALIDLAHGAGLGPPPVALPQPSAAEPSESDVAAWLPVAAEALSLQAEAVECHYEELREVLARCAPAIVRIRIAEERRYLAVLRSSRSKLVLLTTSRSRVSVPVVALRQVLVENLETLPRQRVAGWLEQTSIRGRRQRRAESALLELMLCDRILTGIWLLRMDPGASFAAQLRARGVVARVGLALSFSVLQVALVMGGWVVLGRAALTGSLKSGWLTAWLLTCVSAVPLQLALNWFGSRALTDFASLLKQRLLCGALRLPPDEIRKRGSGRLLAMVSESEALETAGIAGVFGCALAFVQLLSAAIAIGFGAGSLVQLALLAGYCAIVAALAARFLRARQAWTAQRFALTHAFVENVVGNRTRVAQQPARRWHQNEDGLLHEYLLASRRLDSQQLLLQVLPGRGWLILGLFGLIPSLLFAPVTPSQLAISIGATLQAYTALQAFSNQLTTLTGALVAWRQLRELYHAAKAASRIGSPALALGRPPVASSEDPNPVLIEARGLSFRHAERSVPVLNDCSLVVRVGDRLLLEGPSGSGKSTLASLLVGLHEAGRGTVLLHGLDRASLGDAFWRRQVASAPQFHENHVLAGTLAFNLLMGRVWPPSTEDRRAAELLCRELGLGPLIERMPSGLDQIVGENGWQLSHGERSRVFLARALLQQPELLVLDESFGALDPLTLQVCMETVRQRAPALLVIAHP